MQTINKDIIVNQLAASEKRWFAVYTKYKCEKYVCKSLMQKGVHAYIPLIQKTKRYKRKIKQYELPLINCYIFVQIDKSQYLTTIETEYVIKFIRQKKDLIAIPDREIEILKRITGEIIDVSPVDMSSLLPGDEVEVISGQLTGLRGKLVSREGKKSFIVELTSIGFQFRVHIDINLLRPVYRMELSS